MGIQLYDKDHNPINPNTEGSSVVTSAISSANTVDEALMYLNDLISGLSGDKEAVTAIEIVIRYGLSKFDNEGELKTSPPNWSNTFIMPDSEFPYTWKKTLISVANTEKEYYEIVASDTYDSTQTIYVALGTDVQPIIIYPKKVIDGVETTEKDLTAFDNSLPNPNDGYVDDNGRVNVDWSELPQSIAPDKPFSYMSTRKRINGIWTEFSTPAMLGKWAFDSKLEIRYKQTDIQTTKDQVGLNADSTDPGEGWSITTPDTYTGKLWMITATSVNSILNKGSNDIIWDGPHLLSIIKE